MEHEPSVGLHTANVDAFGTIVRGLVSNGNSVVMVDHDVALMHAAGSDLDRIAEAGWRAPSAPNRQHWDFVIVTDRVQLQELSTVWQGARHIASAAAAIALVVPEPPDDRTKHIDQDDLGQATTAMTVAATPSRHRHRPLLGGRPREGPRHPWSPRRSHRLVPSPRCRVSR
jgi:nitroreductase